MQFHGFLSIDRGKNKLFFSNSLYALDTYLWSDIVDNVKEQWWEGVTEKFLTKIMFLFEKFQHYVEPQGSLKKSQVNLLFDRGS